MIHATLQGGSEFIVQVPTELSGIGFVEAILGLAGYAVLTTSAGPLQVPPAGSVQIVKYWKGTDKDTRRLDDSIICVHVLPPKEDPFLLRLPPRLILGNGLRDIFTSVDSDPCPPVPRQALIRDAPASALLPDHLDFGAFRPEPEDMVGVEAESPAQPTRRAPSKHRGLSRGCCSHASAYRFTCGETGC